MIALVREHVPCLGHELRAGLFQLEHCNAAIVAGGGSSCEPQSFFLYYPHMTDLFFTLTQYGDWGLLFLRIAVGTIFLVHGFSKWPMWRMQPSEKMPGMMLATMRFLSVAEPLGGAAVLVGLLTQIAAAGLALVMLGALYLKIRVWKNKFVNGWEFDLALLAANIALALLGAGAWSIDYFVLGF